MLGKARIARKIEIGQIRQLKMEDLPALAVKRDHASHRVQRFRDTHHKLAWLIAAGQRPKLAAAAAGYSVARVSTLMTDPAFLELVATKREQVDEHRAADVDDFRELLHSNMLKAERQIADHLDKADEEDELLPINRLLAISRDSADRLGHGKHTTQVNVNVDFAARLDQAIQRSRAAKQIEANVTLVPASPSGLSREAASPPAASRREVQPQPLQRRRIA